MSPTFDAPAPLQESTQVCLICGSYIPRSGQTAHLTGYGRVHCECVKEPK